MLKEIDELSSRTQEENVVLTKRIQEEREAVVQLRVQLQQAQWRCLPQQSPIAPLC